MSISQFLLEKGAVIFKTRLSLKEEAKCILIHDSAKMQLGVGGLGTSLSIQFRSPPARLSLV